MVDKLAPALLETSLLMTGVILLVVVGGLYRWVYQASVKISSYADRLWGPSWLTFLLFGLACCGFGVEDVMSSGKDSESFFALSLIFFIIAGFFYWFWIVSLNED
jgi:hypothetical protein